MIVSYFYIRRITFLPGEADTPLVIDPDAILAFLSREVGEKIRRHPPKRLQRITPRDSEGAKIYLTVGLLPISMPPF